MTPLCLVQALVLNCASRCAIADHRKTVAHSSFKVEAGYAGNWLGLHMLRTNESQVSISLNLQNKAASYKLVTKHSYDERLGLVK